MYVDQWGEIHPPPEPEKANPLTPASLAAEGAGGSGQKDLEAKLVRYGTAKARNREMAGYLCQLGVDDRHGPYKRLSKALYECASWLEFHRYIETGRTVLANAITCKKHLLCPVCAIRRGGKTLRKYHERAAFLATDNDFEMLTVTVKNGADLAERYRHLKSAWRKLRQRIRDGYGPLAHTRGMVWSFEFTRGQDGLWHPHIHAIVAVPKGSPRIAYGEGSALRHQWQQLTGDSFIVHARPIAGDDLVGGFCEVLKYALKFSSLTLPDNVHAYDTLKGKRLVQAGGCFYGLELPEDDELLDDPEDGPYEVLWYRYTSGGYAKTTHPY
jgi:hypothetical protein